MMLFCGWPPCVFVLLLLTVPCVVLMQLQRKDNGVMLTFWRPPPTVMYVDEYDGNEDDLVGSSHGCAEFHGDESTRLLVLSAAGRGIHVRWCEFWLVP